MSTAERLNARIDAELARKIARLRRLTGETTTQIIKDSVELYYEKVAARSAPPAEVLAATGFIGCAGGDADLSATYKARLTRSLGRKPGK